MTVTIKETQAALHVNCLGQTIELKIEDADTRDAVSLSALIAHGDDDRQPPWKANDGSLYHVAEELEHLAHPMSRTMDIKDAPSRMALLEFYEARLKFCAQAISTLSMQEREADRQAVIDAGQGVDCPSCGEHVAKLSHGAVCSACDAAYRSY